MNSELLSLRKKLHQHPEISGAEEKTAKRIINKLKSLNADQIHTNVGGHGVLAKYECLSGAPKKKILFRAELDAISINEETELAYSSTVPGAMHGCGHDGHMTILTGLAVELCKERPDDVDVYLLYQPSEETGEGAERVQNDERFRKLDIDHGFALHNLPGFPEKSVILKSGTFAAGSVGLDISVTGSFSHAAYPEKGLNPGGTVAKLVQTIDREMQTFRNEDGCNKVVCTFIRMGSRAFGISPGDANIGFTLRSASDDRLNVAVNLMYELIKEVSFSFDGEIAVEKVEPFSATVNSEEGTKIVRSISEKLGLKLHDMDVPFPWSEDFGQFGKSFPIILFGLGAGVNEPTLHSEKYNFNDNLIPAGVVIFSRIVDYYQSL